MKSRLVALILLMVLSLTCWAQDAPLVQKLQQNWRGNAATTERAASLKRASVIKPANQAKDNGWLKRSVERIEHLFSFNPPDRPAMRQAGGLPQLSFLSPLIWLLLIGGVGFLLYLALRNASFSGLKAWAKKRGRGSLIEESEPAYNADEWLAKAQAAAAQGDFRVAMRCYYLGTLVAMDEKRFLRFIRWETNWEHLARYESGSRTLPGVDLRSLTRQFDRVWYGHAGCDAGDLVEFEAAFRAARSYVREGAA